MKITPSEYEAMTPAEKKEAFSKMTPEEIGAVLQSAAPPQRTFASTNLMPCPGCFKDVSNQATSCPHCGHPLNRFSQDNFIAGEGNSSKRGLGIFFIIAGIIGVIIGFIVIQPSNVEGLTQNLAGLNQNYADNMRAANNYLVAVGRSGVSSNFQSDADSNNAKVQNMRSSRQMKAACFFTVGGILFVLGLVLVFG